MRIAETDGSLDRSACSQRSRSVDAGRFGLVVGILALIATGCSSKNEGPYTEGYADQSMTQVMFYAPPGADVTVEDRRGDGMYSRQVGQMNAYGHRLEYTPEEASIFNLAPGKRYEFKYTTASGLPGVSIYGELNVEKPSSRIGRIYQRRAFVPVMLPSEYYQEIEVTGDQIYPYRGETYRTAIDEYDLVRLKQGDVVEKVFFVADLEEAEERLDEVNKEIAVVERELEYADARFKLAYWDFKTDVMSPAANFWGTDREFIDWEGERQELEQKHDHLLGVRQRTRALLNGDHVLARKGMLVLATEEIIEPHRSVEKASDELGDVLLIMRLGGRHMQWHDRTEELTAYEQEIE